MEELLKYVCFFNDIWATVSIKQNRICIYIEYVFTF